MKKQQTNIEQLLLKTTYKKIKISSRAPCKENIGK